MNILKCIKYYEPVDPRISDAEVINTNIVAALYFKGNQNHNIGFI